MNIYKVMAIVIIILSAMVVTAPDLCAGEYLGELCWLVSPVGSTQTSILKLGLYYPGGLHLLSTGKMVAGAVQIPYHGNFELIDNQFQGTLLNAGFTQNAVFNQSFVIFLEPDTLSGIYFGFTESTNIQMPPDLQYTGGYGALTYVSCPTGI